MSNLVGKFNTGGVTSSTIDRQFTEEFVTTAVVEMPKRKKVFGVRADRYTMPKNSGDKLSREVSYGMLDKRVLVDGGVDATTATIMRDVWYRVPAGSKDITTATAIYDTKDYYATGTYATWELARAAAKLAATTGLPSDQVAMSGSGGMFNGEASYAASTNAIGVLPEEGGVVNLLTHNSKMVTANITFHGYGHKFSMRSVELDSRKGLIARKIQYMADAISDLKEMQIRKDLVAASHVNSIICNAAVNPDTDLASEIDGSDILTYTALEALEQYLLNNDVPMDTEILTGTNLIDTKVVSDAWVMYVNTKVIPTLRAMKGPGGVLVFAPKEQYAAGTELLDNEIGKIGSFRFVSVLDLEVEYGAGLAVADGNDSATAAQQAAAYKTNGKYDVFTAMVIGDDSFSITGFGSNNTSAKYIPPVADVHNDMHGQMAGIAANWSYGFLNYRPERICSLRFACSKNPGLYV